MLHEGRMTPYFFSRSHWSLGMVFERALLRTLLAAKRAFRSSWGRALQVVPCPASALRFAGTSLLRTCWLQPFYIYSSNSNTIA